MSVVQMIKVDFAAFSFKLITSLIVHIITIYTMSFSITSYVLALPE